MRSPDVVTHTHRSLRPLLLKEVRAIVSGRALWTMLLILCPVVGYSFFQAVSLYAESSGAASSAPGLASGLSPLDGVLVPTLGAFYVTVTLLFPFVAIRALGREMETGTIRLLVQLPYRAASLLVAKMSAVAVAWLIASVPALLAVAIWAALGGHLYALETFNLLLGHLLYGMLVAAIALFAASVAESAATAAIMTLAVTIGSWVLDFTLAGQPGLLDWLSRLSLTQTLRPFEQGLFSVGLVTGVLASILGFSALAALFLHPGIGIKTKLTRALMCIAATAVVLAVATQARTTIDVTEDGRNSFPSADQRALGQLREPLFITVHLAPEDPRYVDLRRNILSKLERAMPDVRIRLATPSQSFVGSAGDKSYGDVEYVYGGRADTSRSTSHREFLPVLYALAGVSPPAPAPGQDYPGYPLVANARSVLLWFLGMLPPLILLAWWWSSRPPRSRFQPIKDGGRP